MAGLADLPTELLEQIFLHQEGAKDMISLSSSSPRLHQVLSQPRIWRNMLAKADMVTGVKKKTVTESIVNYSLIQMVSVFLKAAADPEVLLGLLHSTICQLHPGVLQGSSVTVLLPLLPGPHSVSVLGLVLLALTEGQGQGPTILTVRMAGPGPYSVTASGVGLQLDQSVSLLGALASLVSLQEEPITYLEVTGTISCSTAEDS